MSVGEGLVHHFRFDGNLNDSVVETAWSPSVQSGKLIYVNPGVIHQAAWADDVDTSVEGESWYKFAGDIMIAFWLNLEANEDSRPFSLACGSISLLIEEDQGHPGTWYLVIYNSQNQVETRMQMTAPSPGQAKRFICVGYWAEEYEYSAYIGYPGLGVDTEVAAGAEAVYTFPFAFSLGANNAVDELMIYNRLLSYAEVMTLFNGGSGIDLFAERVYDAMTGEMLGLTDGAIGVVGTPIMLHTRKRDYSLTVRPK